MSLAPLDFLAGTVCQLTPGTITWGPGWYLIAENTRVEAGPFATEEDAEKAAWWLDEECLGVHPAYEEGLPYRPRFSAHGLLVGSRVRDRKKKDTMVDDTAQELVSILSA